MASPWTRSEIDLLTQIYPCLTAKQIAAKLGRTRRSVLSQADRLGVSKGRVPETERAARTQDVDWSRLYLVYRDICARRGVTCVGAAKRLGIGNIERWKRGTGGMSATSLLVLCAWAEIDPMSFLEDMQDIVDPLADVGTREVA